MIIFLRQLTTWHCPHLLLRAILLLCAVPRRRCCRGTAVQQSIDRPISCLLGPQQHTRRMPLLPSTNGTDKRTDGTDTRPLHRPCSAHCAGSVNNNEIVSKTVNVVQIWKELYLSCLQNQGRYLGVYIDRDLKWTEHINQLYKKCLIMLVFSIGLDKDCLINVSGVFILHLSIHICFMA